MMPPAHRPRPQHTLTAWLGLSAVIAGLAGCSARPAALPDGGPVVPTAPSAPSDRSRATPPPPDDARPAVPDVLPGRVDSPAGGPVRLSVRAAGPAGGADRAAYQAYLGWTGAYLAALARPGQGGDVDRYATPTAAAAVRRQAAALADRGWAEYGTATVVSAGARANGATATVTACLDLSGLATRDAAGRLAGRDRPVRSAATLTLVAGAWLVAADEKTPVPACR
jgi:hypothetical protein